MMERVVVIHYDPAQAVFVADRIRREGFQAEVYAHRGIKGFRGLREDPPAAVLIDLTAMPSYGRVMGCLLREQKGTRSIPLVFLNGDPEKTAQVRAMLPDATFASLQRLGSALHGVIRRPPADPIIPKPALVAAAAKLKIREGSRVALRGAPQGFESKLGPLPSGVRFGTGEQGADVVLTFLKSAAALGRELPSLARLPGPGRTIWIAWPKKASQTPSDLTMPRIVEMCGLYGLTAYKSCALDETWSAVAIAPRRK